MRRAAIPKSFDMGLPILGICYGMQLGIEILGGQVKAAKAREYGRAKLSVTGEDALVRGLPKETTVWMSHGDQIHELPDGFHRAGDDTHVPLRGGPARQPAVLRRAVSSRSDAHAPGRAVLPQFFLRDLQMPGLLVDGFLHRPIAIARSANRSAGTLSSADFKRRGRFLRRRGTPAQSAIGDQLVCIFVDNGLLRKNEKQLVESTFRDHFKINLRTSEAGSAVSGPAEGRDRPAAEAENHRQGIHRGVQARGDEHPRMPSSWRRARSIPM